MTYRKFTRGVMVTAMLCLGLPFMAQAQLEGLEIPVDETETETMPAPLEPQLNEDGLPILTKVDVDTWLDGYMPYALETGEIAGAVVSIVKDGEILTSRGFGFADLETRRPMDGEETMIRPGSVSKLFTWTAVMQQVEQGNIKLDEDINTYLDFEIESPSDEPITVRHLMTHTAGFEEVVRNLILTDPDQLLTLEEYLKAYIPPGAFAPGTTPAYSNYATAVAGYIVARVSGMSFEDYIDANILQPLDMNSSTFEQPLPARFESRMSKGYADGANPEAGEYELVPAGPAGSLVSTASDMAKFMIAHLDEGGPLLEPETSEQLMSPQMDITPPLNTMSLGFYKQDFNNLRSRGHGGDTMFFHSDLYLLLDENVGLFISMNSSSPMVGVLRGELANKFAKRYFADASIEFEPRLETAKVHAAQVSGVYESSRSSETSFLALVRYLGQFPVSADANGDLILRTLSPNPGRWREVEPYVWRRVGGHERFAAKLNESGDVSHVTFEPISPFTIYMKPPWYRSSALLNPLLYAGLGFLFLTVLFWPVRAIVRRRFGYTSVQERRETRSYHLVRIAILFLFGVLGLWMMILSSLEADLTSLSGSFDTKLIVTQLGQVFFYIALALSIWNAFVVWTSRQSWFAKLWSVVLILSILVVIWFAYISGLMHIGTGF